MDDLGIMVGEIITFRCLWYYERTHEEKMKFTLDIKDRSLQAKFVLSLQSLGLPR